MSCERECRYGGPPPRGSLARTCSKGHIVRDLMRPGGRVPCFTMPGREDLSHECPDFLDTPRTELLGREVGMIQLMDAMIIASATGLCPKCGAKLESRANWLFCKPCDVSMHTSPERPEHDE